MKKNCLPVLLLLGLQFSGKAQDFSLYKKKVFKSDSGTLNYRILYPEKYDPSKKYPLIIFLHGSGERGDDNEKQLFHGGAFFIKDSIRRIFPSIVILPQCPENISWSMVGFHYDSAKEQPDIVFDFRKNPTRPALLVKQLADSFIRAGIADPGAMFIGGLSLGGFGTFDFTMRYPEYFAASFPICGGGDTSYLKKIAKKLNASIWIFHGGADPVVSVRYSRQAYQALLKYKPSNIEVKYTEYPGVGHNSWDNVFVEPGLMEWLMSKQVIDIQSFKKEK